MINFRDFARSEQGLAQFNLSRFKEFYNFKRGDTSENGVAVAGDCGHLFIGEGANRWLSQLSTTYDPWDLGVDPWLSLLKIRQTIARDLNIKFLNLVIPEKQLVFHRFFGHEDFPENWNNRPIERLISNIDCSLPFIYPLEAMRDVESFAELYTRGNSHFCSTGCIVVAFSVTKAFDIDFDFDALRFYRSCYQHDLMSHMYKDPPIEEAIRVGTPGVLKPVRHVGTEGSQTGSGYVIQFPRANTDRTIAIFGDSYSFDAGLSHALSPFFKETHCRWTKDVDWDYVQENKITHVLWESAERFIATVPRA